MIRKSSLLGDPVIWQKYILIYFIFAFKQSCIYSSPQNTLVYPTYIQKMRAAFALPVMFLILHLQSKANSEIAISLGIDEDYTWTSYHTPVETKWHWYEVPAFWGRMPHCSAHGFSGFGGTRCWWIPGNSRADHLLRIAGSSWCRLRNAYRRWCIQGRGEILPPLRS